MSLVYFALWVIFSGRVTLEVLAAGAVVSLLLDQFVKHILGVRIAGVSFWKCLKLFPDAVLCVIVLLIGLIRASIAFTRSVFAPEVSIAPCLVKFTVPLRSVSARAFFANFAALMPGNVTVSLDGCEILVHALNMNAAKSLKESIFVRLLARMERIVHA